MPHKGALGTPMSQSHEPEAGIERKLRKKQPAQPLAGVIHCRGGPLKIVRSGETDHPVSQVLLLQQDEDDENDDDAGRRQRMDERSNQRPKRLKRARIWLADLDGYRLFRRCGCRRGPHNRALAPRPFQLVAHRTSEACSSVPPPLVTPFSACTFSLSVDW